MMMISMTTIFSLMLSIIPHEDVLRDNCDLAEVNHFYDENGKLVFDQVIFYDWDWEAERYQIRAWRLVKSPNILPVRDWVNGGYYSLWQDNLDVRRVMYPSIRETWTQYDPELIEREFLPKERRKELRKR